MIVLIECSFFISSVINLIFFYNIFVTIHDLVSSPTDFCAKYRFLKIILYPKVRNWWITIQQLLDYFRILSTFLFTISEIDQIHFFTDFQLRYNYQVLTKDGGLIY